MKVKGRANKWIPGRSRSSEEEGAIGGQGFFRPTLSPLASGVRTNSSSSRREGVAERANKSNRVDEEKDLGTLEGAAPISRIKTRGVVGNHKGCGLLNSSNRLDSTLLLETAETSSFLQGLGGSSSSYRTPEFTSTTTSCIRPGSGSTVSSSYPGEEFELLAYPGGRRSHRGNNEDDDDSCASTIREVVSVDHRISGNGGGSGDKGGIGGGRRSRHSSGSTVEYMKVETVCTMNIPTDDHIVGGGGSGTPSSGPGPGDDVISNASTPAGDELPDDSNHGESSASIRQTAQNYIRLLRKRLSLQLLGRFRPPSRNNNGNTAEALNIHANSNYIGNHVGQRRPMSNGNALKEKTSLSAASDANVDIGLEPVQTQLSTTGSAVSPNRKVTFDDDVIPAPEAQGLYANNVRVVKVRDAGCDTADGLDEHIAMNTSQTDTDKSNQIPSARRRMRKDEDDDDDTSDMSSTYIRETWSNKMDFFVSALGYAVGLGNVCRFPYLCYRNGGGAFLLPYFIFMVLVGIPLLFLEMSLGQFAGLGSISIWNVAPLFKGIGITMVILSFVVSIYYNVILSWSMFYLFASMQSPLPWTSCNNTWNTQACCTTRFYSLGSCDKNTNNKSALWNTSCLVVCGDDIDLLTAIIDLNKHLHSSVSIDLNLPLNTSNVSIDSMLELHWYLQSVNRTHRLKSPAEEYFSEYVMGGSDFTGALGGLRWHLALCLLLSCIIVFLCFIKGTRSSGKVVYVTVIAPYLILFILLVKTAMLDGADKGIAFYISPQWHRLKDPQVWHDAISQLFFSLAPCYGGVLSLASFNKFHHNCYRDALLVPLLNCLTSVFAGFPVFCTLGFMAHKLGTDIGNVVSSGWGLAFIVYPEALSRMPGATFWSLIFFLLVLALGIDSLLGFVVTIVTAVLDEYSKVLLRWRLAVVVAVCAGMFLLGLPLVTQAGPQVLEVLDQYATSYPPVVLGILECVVLMWVYGYTRFSQDVWYMFGKQPGRWWRFLWQFATPGLLLFMLIFSSVARNLVPPKDESLSAGWTVVGWAVAGLCIIPVPAYAIYSIVTTPGNFVKRWRRLVNPAEGWGVFPEDNSPESVPDYIRSEETDPDEVVASVGDIPDLPPHPDGHTDTNMGNSVGYVGVDEDDIDTGSLSWSEDENKERGNWHGRYDFLVAGIGYTVGLGNVWRFPYLVYKNGGGAFFLPYMLMLILCGVPLFFMELALGQFASSGCLSIWKLSPLFKGLGYAMVCTQFLYSAYYNVLSGWAAYYLCASMTTSHLPWVDCNNTWNTPGVGFASCITVSLLAIYYNAMTSWSIFYFCASMTSQLPWSTCGNPWNTPACRDSNMPEVTESANATLEPPRVENWSYTTANPWENCTNATYFNITPTSPSEEYFFNYVLNISSGIDDWGSVQWPLATCLLASSLISFAALIRGVKSIGKVVYVTASFPYLILFVLLARYVTLGSSHLDGIKFYVTPTWSRLRDAAVWGDAASQLFFSLGLSMGGLMSLSSYNRFHYDCYRDAYLICLVDTLTSVFAGFVIFAILGVMAAEKGTDVQNVITSKFALAYIVYPEAVSKLPIAPFWSLLFFLMLFTLAIDSQFLMTAGLVISIMDEFPSVLGRRRVTVIAAVCTTLYLIGLPMASQAGYYMVVLFDQYVAAWTPVVVATLTCITVCWVYGMKSIINNVRAMLGSEPSIWYQTMWKYVTPAILVALLVFVWGNYRAPSLDGYSYPSWAHAIGLILGLGPLAVILLVATVQVCRTPGSGCVRLVSVSLPSINWAPALLKHQMISLPPIRRRPSQISIFSEQEMSIYATETSAIVAMSAYANVQQKSSKKREKTVTISTSGESNDKNIQTDGGLIEEDSIVVVSPSRQRHLSQSTDASTQTLNHLDIDDENTNYMKECDVGADKSNVLVGPKSTKEKDGKGLKKSSRKSSRENLDTTSAQVHPNSGIRTSDTNLENDLRCPREKPSSDTNRSSLEMPKLNIPSSDNANEDNLSDSYPGIKLEVTDTEPNAETPNVRASQPTTEMSYLNIDPSVVRQFSRETNVSLDPVTPTVVTSPRPKTFAHTDIPESESEQPRDNVVNFDTDSLEKLNITNANNGAETRIASGDGKSKQEPAVSASNVLRFIDDSGSDGSDPDVMDTYL